MLNPKHNMELLLKKPLNLKSIHNRPFYCVYNYNVTWIESCTYTYIGRAIYLEIKKLQVLHQIIKQIFFLILFLLYLPVPNVLYLDFSINTHNLIDALTFIPSFIKFSLSFQTYFPSKLEP